MTVKETGAISDISVTVLTRPFQSLSTIITFSSKTGLIAMLQCLSVTYLHYLALFYNAIVIVTFPGKSLKPLNRCIRCIVLEVRHHVYTGIYNQMYNSQKQIVHVTHGQFGQKIMSEQSPQAPFWLHNSTVLRSHSINNMDSKGFWLSILVPPI